MDGESANAALSCFSLLWPFILLLVTYFIGSWAERRHLADIVAREAEYRAMPVVTFEDYPGDWVISSSGLVTGSVVISIDYFKRFLAGLRGLIGGRVKSYEPLLDRARRRQLDRPEERFAYGRLNEANSIRQLRW